MQASIASPNGIVLFNATSVLVSGRETPTGTDNGPIRRFDLTTNALQAYGPPATLSGTGDFGLFGEMLYLPKTDAGTVIIQHLE